MKPELEEKLLEKYPLAHMVRDCSLDDWIANASAKIMAIEMLNWFDSICRQGMTVGMLRRAIWNKRVEITGEGEKA